MQATLFRKFTLSYKKQLNLKLENLIKKCIKNDRLAQRELYDTFSDRLYIVALTYLKDRFLAEDIIVKTFMNVFQSLDNFQYENEAKFAGWLRRIVVNESLMEIRRRKLIPEFVSEKTPVLSNQLAETGIFYDDILKIIETLPEGYRMIFKLYVIEGYSHSEIADLLGISEGTSKSQLHKSRMQLQQLLIQNEIDYD